MDASLMKVWVAVAAYFKKLKKDMHAPAELLTFGF